MAHHTAEVGRNTIASSAVDGRCNLTTLGEIRLAVGENIFAERIFEIIVMVGYLFYFTKL